MSRSEPGVERTHAGRCHKKSNSPLLSWEMRHEDKRSKQAPVSLVSEVVGSSVIEQSEPGWSYSTEFFT